MSSMLGSGRSSSILILDLTITDCLRFTGPKMTLSEDMLADEQQEAITTEGLEVNIEPHNTAEAQNASTPKDLEKSQ